MKPFSVRRSGLALVTALLCASCATFGLPKARTFTKPQLTREQVDQIRTTLINNGYEPVGRRDDEQEDGRLLTRYAKEIDAGDGSLVKVEAWLKFLQKDPSSDVYTDVEITVNSFERKNAGVANQEIARMNEILKAQLAKL